MGTITTRIALLAYVVGGWLLPAIHHHGASCDHANTIPAEAASFYETVVGASAGLTDSHENCGHDHSHDHVDTELNVNTAGELALQGGASDLVHDGLCALCSARSLTGTHAASSAILLSRTTIKEIAGYPSLARPFSVIHGSSSPRGPPTIV